MTTNKIPSLVDLETQVKQLTSSRHQKEILLITNIINMYIRGFQLIESFTFTKDNEVESAWLLLITRSFHSMRCAFQLMLTGYYGQSISLLRTITENIFICHDCSGYPKTIEAILYNKYKIPGRKYELTFYKMAERTGNMRIYKNDYDHQSRVNHPTALSLGMLRDPQTNELRAAPSYDNILFLDCCEILIRNSLMMNEFMGRFLSKLSGTKAKSWGEKAVQTCKDASEWLRALREKYGEENAPTIKPIQRG